MDSAPSMSRFAKCVAVTNGFCFWILSNFDLATNPATISGPCFPEREGPRRLRFFCYKAPRWVPQWPA